MEKFEPSYMGACTYAKLCLILATLWTVAHQAPLSMGFSRQEYWRGLSCPPPGDLPNPGIESGSLALAGGFFTTSATWEAQRLSPEESLSFLSSLLNKHLLRNWLFSLTRPMKAASFREITAAHPWSKAPLALLPRAI